MHDAIHCGVQDEALTEATSIVLLRAADGSWEHMGVAIEGGGQKRR